jgi:hypothetical protein
VVGHLVFAIGAVFCGDVHVVRLVFCCPKTTGYPQLGMHVYRPTGAGFSF